MTRFLPTTLLRSEFLLAIALLSVPVSVRAEHILENASEVSIKSASAIDFANSAPALIEFERFVGVGDSLPLGTASAGRENRVASPLANRYHSSDVTISTSNTIRDLTTKIDNLPSSLLTSGLDRLAPATIPSSSNVTSRTPSNVGSLSFARDRVAPPTATPKVATNILPTIPAVNVVLKLKERKAYVYQGENILASYPVGIGRKGRETPTGEWYVMETLTNPGWTDFNTGKYLPPGPNNPMGTRWIGFWTDGQDMIGFHGTTKVSSIGKAVSSGCVRMLNQDVQALYAFVKVGTIVRVVNE